MLSSKQSQFREEFLAPFRQKIYFLKSLPMGLLSGIRLTYLDEEKSVAEVPFWWLNKNPFTSIYFAVQSMAAELSTAAPVILALKGLDTDVAFIIVELKAEFIKKAQSRVEFTCEEYMNIHDAMAKLSKPGDTITVTAKTVGRDISDEEVARFYFTWSFKVR